MEKWEFFTLQPMGAEREHKGLNSEESKIPQILHGLSWSLPGWEFLGNVGMAPLGIWEWLPWSLPELGIPWECPLRTAGMAPLGSS